MTGTLPPIAGFWAGETLGFIEQLSIQSALDAGHRYLLFSYEPVLNAPSGAEVRDARTVLAPDEGLTDRRRAVVHSDRFRIALLQKMRVIWADLDCVIIRPVAPLDGHVHGFAKEDRVGTSILALPPESPTLAAMGAFLGQRNPVPPWAGPGLRAEFEAKAAAGARWDLHDLTWGVAGPKALTYFLNQTGEVAHSQPQAVFYPIRQGILHWTLADWVHPSQIETPSTLAVHVFGYARRLLLEQHGGVPPRGSWLELVCDRHGISPEKAPLSPL
ncbi:MAG: hypothetical protein AAGJ96_05975 [Pseudomonadota bacterium]